MHLGLDCYKWESPCSSSLALEMPLAQVPHLRKYDPYLAFILQRVSRAGARKEFARQLGYRVALVARRLKDLQVIADEIIANGGEVCLIISSTMLPFLTFVG